nr:hypothetical protein [Chlamydiota bacterium]
MKKKWHWLALWLTLLPLVGSAEGEPNSYQKVVIERFLKTTFSSSGFGYVFEGAKPLAIFNV